MPANMAPGRLRWRLSDAEPLRTPNWPGYSLQASLGRRSYPWRPRTPRPVPARCNRPVHLPGRCPPGSSAWRDACSPARIPVHAGPLPMETSSARRRARTCPARRPAPALDAISRRWLAKQDSGYLPEIDAIARRLARPGAYFLSVNYEWGCTCKVGPSPDQKSARLVRVLDWLTPGSRTRPRRRTRRGCRRPIHHADVARIHRAFAGNGAATLCRRAQPGAHARAPRLLPSRLGGRTVRASGG